MRTFFNFIVTNNPAPNSPKENSGASGGLLPKSRIFSCWKIPLPRHTARILGGQNPKKKNILSILEKEVWKFKKKRKKKKKEGVIKKVGAGRGSPPCTILSPKNL